MHPDEYLDDVVGQDAWFTADCFGCDARVKVRVDGEIPGAVDLIVDAPEKVIAERLRGEHIAACRHPKSEDELVGDIAYQAVQAAVLDLLNSAAPQSFHANDITYEPGPHWRDDLQITVRVGSRQSETLGVWADRIGRTTAEALACGFPDNIATRMRP